MAINPSSEYPGRITAPDANYTYGSSKNESSPGAGDGTPYEILRANDVFGFQQALLRLSSIVPNGNAETQLVSQYLQALVELASGRATNYDESGVADAYVLDVRSNQQGPGDLFDGMKAEFTPSADNTGATTADVAGTGIKNVFFNGAALTGGELVTTKKATIEYDLTNDRHNLFSEAGGGFVSGTLMLFQQTSAPVGWTKETTHNNKSLRVVTGAAGSGGATAFTTVFGVSKVSASHVLLVAEMPSHTHLLNTTDGTGSTDTDLLSATGVGAETTKSTGGDSGHDHDLSLDLEYVDIIIASKN